LKVSYSVQVKRKHSVLHLPKKGCEGVLRADGFSIEYQSTCDRSIKLNYDVLKSISFSKGKIVLESSDIPDGRLELEQTDTNPSPSLAEVYTKIEEYRNLRQEYLRTPNGP
jgi:hypothetical protein